jgi:hypothetical protein
LSGFGTADTPTGADLMVPALLQLLALSFAIALFVFA